MEISPRVFNAILVTGGAGFIGSNLIRSIFEDKGFKGNIVNLDKLTYAGNLSNLEDVANDFSDRYTFIQGDICDNDLVSLIFQKYQIDAVCHLAAESHVDRSIEGPKEFIHTNILGTFTLLDNARKYWAENLTDKLFHHVSTDEVYGSLDSTGYFYEDTHYDPRSPYSASKASSDHLVRSYYYTFGLPMTLSNCSNNYGPYQFPEKLIPVMIENIIEKKKLPVYGDGKNIRDWLYVVDHNYAIWKIMQSGKLGESYNIGGDNEWENIKLVETLCDLMDTELQREKNSSRALITFVKDRPGHDRRYSINCDKLKNEFKWSQTVDFEQGLLKTVQWYLSNREWSENVKSGEYRNWLETNYSKR